MLRPEHPDPNNPVLHHTLNCGTWLTYFLSLDPSYDPSWFSNFYLQHYRYMFPRLRSKLKILLTQKNGQWFIVRYIGGTGSKNQIIDWSSLTPITEWRKHFYVLREVLRFWSR